MPPLPDVLLDVLLNSTNSTNSTIGSGSGSNFPSNFTEAVSGGGGNDSATNPDPPDYLQVICAWPVSGQYGPGSYVRYYSLQRTYSQQCLHHQKWALEEHQSYKSRALSGNMQRFLCQGGSLAVKEVLRSALRRASSLYYVLVSTCVLARKAEWLRNACLAAALLFPAVAALHSIVLATLHNPLAVDMDVFGAFQLCSIGILAAPVTVRLSRTYFYDPGRNMIFLWTGLILAGLLSLTIEFYRITPVPCSTTDPSFLSSKMAPSQFPYGETCGLTCSSSLGPYNPMRRGAADDIYVIPAPTKLTFNTATLLAAACCIPAVLSLVSMWYKILEINWKSRFGPPSLDETIEGTNGATVGKMKGVNEGIRFFLSVIEVPVFCGAVLAILVIGEMNFFSTQVFYQTEPIQSIGQWAPVVGTGLAALGSGYIFLATDADQIEGDRRERRRRRLGHEGGRQQEEEEELGGDGDEHHCNCSHSHHGIDPGPPAPESFPHPLSTSPRSSGDRDATSIDLNDMAVIDSTDINGRSCTPPSTPRRASPNPSPSCSRSQDQITPPPAAHLPSSDVANAGNRPRVAQVLTRIGRLLGTAQPDWFDDSDFKHGRALDFPEIPGEKQRNPDLTAIQKTYNQPRDDDYDDVAGGASRGGSRSRAASRLGSMRSFSMEEEGDDASSPGGGGPISRRSTCPPHQPPYTAVGLPVPLRNFSPRGSASYAGRAKRSNTLPVNPGGGTRSSIDSNGNGNGDPSTAAGPSRGRTASSSSSSRDLPPSPQMMQRPARRDTLTVPGSSTSPQPHFPVSISMSAQTPSARNNPPGSPMESLVPPSPISPAVVVSGEGGNPTLSESPSQQPTRRGSDESPPPTRGLPS
ncbi:hypothetical protein MKZ38_007273 [Zalerion maritima]|uniref:Uncharacterized protein n=1 Tax=Zalerion maritima TaxID=339359 RepID=A0AAD5RUZ2_9PEZI|nr:hypothetical protein MKZ38_007273 [Zalerion maritima]